MFVTFVKRDLYKAKKNEDFIKFILKYNLVLCMGKGKLQQTLLIELFKTITRVKINDVLQKEVKDINESAKQKAPMFERVEKSPIGRPKKIVATQQFEKQIKHEGVKKL
jgi:hypothetical protein